jgi:hypothetical protein
MSLDQLLAAVAEIPPGSPNGAWLRERLAFFETARKHGLSLERILGIEPVGRAARSRRDHLLGQLHRECFPSLPVADVGRRIDREIRRYLRSQWPTDRARAGSDGTQMGELLFEIVSLDVPLGCRTLLRALEDF